MKRQRNRSRGGGGGGGGGGGKPQHNANRAFDSNGPDSVKVRGAAQHIYEKYQQLARDAGSAGDRVLAENYLQHAEHYFRVLRAMQPQRPVGEIIGRDQFASGYDIDFEEEPGAADEGGEPAELEASPEPRRDDRPYQRDDRPYQRDDRPQRDDRGPRTDRPQGDFRPREDRDEWRRDDRGEVRQADRFRDDRRERFGRDERRFQSDRPPPRQERDFRAERPDRDPLGVIEPQSTPLTAPAPSPAPARYEPRDASGGVLRGEDGATSQAPAFLQQRPDARPEGEDEAARRPRRRRAPRSFDPGQTEPADAEEG